MERWLMWLILVIVALTILNRQLQTSEFFALTKSLFQSIEALGLLGKVMITAFIALATALALSFGIAEIALSSLFPPQESLLMIFLGRIVGAFLSYFLASSCPLISGNIKNWLVSNKYLESMARLIHKQPYKYALLIRFSNLPAPLKNYGLALLGLSVQCFCSCSLIEILLMSFVKVYLGRQVRVLVDNYQTQGRLSLDYPNYIISGCGILIMLYLSYVAYQAVEEGNHNGPQVKPKTQ